MPWSIEEGKDYIKELLNSMIKSPKTRVLDLGCGMGTYGKLIEKPCYKIGVDAVDYYRQYALMLVYNKFYCHDIRDTEWLLGFDNVDISICGDVLEHLSIADAESVLRALQATSGAIIVALPFTWEQKGWLNKFEDHLQSDLTPEIVAERYPDLKPLKIYTSTDSPWNGRPYYGYYIWQKEGN